MKRYFKTAVFMAGIVIITCYSRIISEEFKKGYSDCISIMANNTVGLDYFNF